MARTSAVPPATRRLDLAALLKECAIAAAIALMLFITMVGLHTVNRGGRLVIETRFGEVVIAVALVFLGRVGLVLIRQGFPVPVMVGATAIAVGGIFVPLPTTFLTVITIAGGAVLTLWAAWSLWRRGSGAADAGARDAAMDRFGARVQDATKYIGPVAVVFAVALPFLFSDRNSIDLATVVLTYIMLGWGLNIIVGLAGLLDLGYVAFYAVGAYSYALLATYFGWGFWICLPLAGVFAAAAGLILGFPVLRLRGDYFAIVTLGFGEIIRVILLNWYDFTGGPDGVSGIPRPSFFGLAEFSRRGGDETPAFHEMMGIEFDSLHRLMFLYYLILALALIVNFVSIRIRRLPLGRAWEALREDDVACQSLGINRRNIKLAAFTISATFGGFAGSFFATRQGFISPESFTFIESAIILSIVVLGGMGSQAGVVLAAILLIGLPEIFRELEQYRMLAFGAAMVAIMVWRPRGLLAHREPSVRLHGPKGAKPVPAPAKVAEAADPRAAAQ